MDEKRDVSLKNASLYNFDTEIIKAQISKTKSDSPPANSSGKRINKIEIGEPFNFRHVAHSGFDGNFNEDKNLQPTPSNTNETEVTELKLSDIIRSNLTDEPNSRPYSTIVRHSIISKDQISQPSQFRHLIHIGTINGESPPPASMHKVRVDGVDVYFNDESYSNLATKIHKPVFMGEERYVDERKPNSTLEHETLSRTTNELQHEISSSLAQPQTNKRTISPDNIENSNSNSLQSIPDRPTPKPRRLRQAPPPPQTEIKPPEAIPHAAVAIKPPEAIPHAAIAIKPPQEVNKPITKPPLPKPRTKLPAPPPPQTINSNPIETINNKQLHSNPTFDNVSARTTINELQKNPSNLYLKLNDAPIANKEGNHPPRLYEASHVISQRIQPESPTTPRQDMPEIVPRKRDPGVPEEPRSTTFEVKSIKPPLPPKSKKPPLRPVIFDDEPEHDPEPDEDANEFSTEPTVSPMGQHYGDVPSVRSLTKRAVQLPSDVPQKLSNEAKYLQNFQIHDSSSWPQRENDNKKNEVNRYENVKQVWEEIEMEKTSNATATPLNLEAKNEVAYRTKQPSSLTAVGRIRRTKSLVLSDSQTEENKLERAKIPVRL